MRRVRFVHHIKNGVLLTCGLTLCACYDYTPIGPIPNPSESPSSKDRPSPLPRQSELSTVEREALESKSKVLLDQCSATYPDISGQRAARVRCLVKGNEAIWSQSVSDGQKERQQLGAYAIQLAEQEDRGTITREQAESQYEEFAASIFEGTGNKR